MKPRSYFNATLLSLLQTLLIYEDQIIETPEYNTRNSMKAVHNGLLCAIEGIDGAGKTTLIKNLAQQLTALNLSVLCTREPGGTELGTKIRTFLADRNTPTCLKSEFLLFAADRAQHFHERILPHLKKGFIVLSDRMSDSSLAYQGFLKGLELSTIKQINEWCMESMKPDIVIYLKIDADTALNRIKVERGIMTKFEEEYQDRMHILIQGFEKTFKDRDNVITINALDAPEKITQKALEEIELFLAKKKNVVQANNTTQFSSFYK